MSIANLEYTLRGHLTMSELEAGLDEIRCAPRDEGVLELIVRRPAVNDREILEEAELHLVEGLVGDSWKRRRSKTTPDGSPNPLMQLNIMNSRATALVARNKDRWQLAGDQLYLDMDLSEENVPAGTRLSLGAAVMANNAPPHLGCQKFVAFRSGGDEVCKFADRQTTPSSRPQRKSDPGRNNSPGRCRQENLTNSTDTWKPVGAQMSGGPSFKTQRIVLVIRLEDIVSPIKEVGIPVNKLWPALCASTTPHSFMDQEDIGPGYGLMIEIRSLPFAAAKRFKPTENLPSVSRTE